jgi:hypothetical protein
MADNFENRRERRIDAAANAQQAIDAKHGEKFRVFHKPGGIIVMSKKIDKKPE